jgi:hypothetical protein
MMCVGLHGSESCASRIIGILSCAAGFRFACCSGKIVSTRFRVVGASAGRDAVIRAPRVLRRVVTNISLCCY